MRFRSAISILAAIGTLLHAGALVRHHALMLGILLQHHALVADLGVICHGSAGTVAALERDIPSIPRPTDAENGCPLCLGMAPAFTLPVAYAVCTAVASDHQSWRADAPDGAPSPLRTLPPPSRGPPLIT
jgi:hypothetical protein